MEAFRIFCAPLPKMEIAVLAGGLYVLSRAMEKTVPSGIPLDPSAEALHANLRMTPAEFFKEEYIARGAQAPPYANQAYRLPWTCTRPPYYVAHQVPCDVDPVASAYTLLINGQDHVRREVAQDFDAAQTTWSRHRSGANWNAFTPEIPIQDADGSLRWTNRMGFQWLPKEPSDTDYQEAGMLAKALPGAPALFTPDATFMTAPGLDFRYGEVN